MDKIKLTYNKVLKRYNKAVEWLDDPARTEEELKRYTPEFIKILGQLNRLIQDAQKRGYDMTSGEIVEGFANQEGE